ncbi:MAG: LacI family DNA-binding transcriptional regulator [Eubacteriales bacterium]
MTYRKIAQLAGVSLSTVSKALSGSPEISAETVNRIRMIAEEYGVIRPKYRRNRPATRIAIIVPEIVSVYYSQTVSGLVSELRRFGIEPYIHLCGFDSERFCMIIEQLTDERLADGIITLSDIPYPLPLEIPMVRLTARNLTDRSDTVYCDLESGIFEALEFLMALGHRRIGFIGEKNTKMKLAYFKSNAARLGLEADPKLIYTSIKRFAEIGSEAAEYYMTLDEKPTALLAAYDEVALGAIHTFTQSGIRVPEDISIIGINDIPSASYASVPLTTIRTYASEINSLGVKLLLDHIKDPEKHIPQQVLVRCELIIRDTTSRIRTEQNQ